MTSAQRILIIRPSALGDVCRSVPVLASLRRAFPDATIDWIVQDGFEDAIRAHPMLDGVIRFPRKQFSGWWRKPSVMRDVIRWGQSLKRNRYDMVFDFQGLGRSGLMTWITRSPKRVGLRTARECAWLAYNHRHPASPRPHTVDEMLWLLECEGIEVVRDMQLHAPQEDVAWWQEQRAELGVAGEYVVLAPTSRWASKRWPIDLWCELLEPLKARGLSQVVVIGAPNERAQVQKLVELPDVTDLVGASSVGQTMAVIRSASLVVANDSAPLHMAVGFARPTVALFGPTDPARVGPYRLDHAVIRAPLPEDGRRINFRDDSLGDSLMRKISPAAVVERIDEALATAEHAGTQERRVIDEQQSGTSAGMDASHQADFAPATSRQRSMGL